MCFYVQRAYLHTNLHSVSLYRPLVKGRYLLEGYDD